MNTFGMLGCRKFEVGLLGLQYKSGRTPQRLLKIEVIKPLLMPTFATMKCDKLRVREEVSRRNLLFRLAEATMTLAN
jgi:hypothetical protein